VKDLLNRFMRSIPGGRGQGPDDPDRLAREVVRLHEEGRYRQAQDSARRLVEVQRGRLGPHHPDYASALTNLALLIQTRGDLDAAEPLLREALGVRKDALGERDPQYAAGLSRVADLLLLRGDLDAAEPLMRQALEVHKEALGEHHPDYASGLTGLALLLHRRGDGEAAEPLLRQALEVRRESLGDRHPMVASALGNVGLVLQGRGDPAGAEAHFRQALEIRRESLGERHPDYAASLSHLGTLLYERGDHGPAEPLLRQAVSVRKDALGPRHPDVLADLRTLEAIVQARPTLLLNGPGGPAPAEDPIPAFASDRALEQLGRGPREIAAEARGLAETFARVGAALAHAAQGMQHGLPPLFPMLNDAAACHNAFVALHQEASRRAEALGLAPSASSLLSLPELAALMDLVGQTEDEFARRAAVLRQATGVIDRVLSLRHRVPSESLMLIDCHEPASSLRAALAVARVSDELPDEATRLADGSHPFAALARLAGQDADLGDDDWHRLHAEVAAHFGRPLAAAAVRGRLTTTPAQERVGSRNGTPPQTTR